MTGSDLVLLIDGRRAGTVRSGPSGPQLAYDQDYAERRVKTPLSTAFPITAGGAYPPQKLNCWLEGLLPDNRDVRREWRRRFDIRGNSAIAILGSPVGRDCAGSVQFCPADEMDDLLARGGDIEWQSNKQVNALVKSLRSNKSTWHGQGNSNYGRFSLSGAQAKTAVVCADNAYGIPQGTEPSTHIIKPAINDVELPDQALNEHVCLQTALNLGLSAVRSQVRYFGSVQCIVIQRFDRATDDNGRVVRIHQEDLCQALGIHPEYKYQGDGGPSPQDIMRAIRQHSSLVDRDAEKFLDALIFNWVMAGTDAHAKNYSFLLRDGAIQLAPLYDIASFLPYESDPNAIPKLKLAMKIGKKYTLSKSDRKSAWHKTGTSLGFDGDETVARTENLAKQIPNALHKAAQALPPEFSENEMIEILVERVDKRASQCARVSQLVGNP